MDDESGKMIWLSYEICACLFCFKTLFLFFLPHFEAIEFKSNLISGSVDQLQAITKEQAKQKWQQKSLEYVDNSEQTM